MIKRIQFNTRRMYSREGQRIVAILHTDDVVTFMDHDRMIGGEFQLGQHCRLNDVEVMHHYDGGSYTMSSRAMTKDHAWQ